MHCIIYILTPYLSFSLPATRENFLSLTKSVSKSIIKTLKQWRKKAAAAAQKNATHVKLLFSITQEQSKQKKLYTQTVNKAKEKEQLNGMWVVIGGG